MHAKSQPSQTLVLFDFDGTLYPKDSFTGFVFYTLKPVHVIWRGLSILPWIIAYYLKFYPAQKMRGTLFHAMFKGCAADQMEACAQCYAQQIFEELDPTLYTQLKQHQALGHQVVLVSASVDTYLKYIAALLNVELICTQVDIQQEKLSGQYVTADCSYIHKKQRVLEQFDLNQYATVYAYGNSIEDEDMLSLAQYAYKVGTTPQLPPLR